VEDQTMLQPQSILRKMALIPIVRNKAIKERIKERKIDTENLMWFGYNVYAYVHDYTRKYLYFWCILKLYIESLI